LGVLVDGVARLQQALLLGLLDHVPGDARLDRAGGVHDLQLGEHAVDLEQRRVADGVEDRARDAGVAQGGAGAHSAFSGPRVQLGGSLAGKLCSLDRKSVVEGKSVEVGGRSIHTKYTSEVCEKVRTSR